jgi:uncharacterized coiled-coil protein SlyX
MDSEKEKKMSEHIKNALKLEGVDLDRLKKLDETWTKQIEDINQIKKGMSELEKTIDEYKNRLLYLKLLQEENKILNSKIEILEKMVSEYEKQLVINEK